MQLSSLSEDLIWRFFHTLPGDVAAGNAQEYGCKMNKLEPIKKISDAGRRLAALRGASMMQASIPKLSKM